MELNIVDLSAGVEHIDLTAAAADGSQIADLLSLYDEANTETAAIKAEAASSQEPHLGVEEKEEEEEEDEASAPEPEKPIPCPVCCEYIKVPSGFEQVLRPPSVMRASHVLLCHLASCANGC